MHKRVARLLIRLYPRQWRERYADEFAALLDDGGLTYRMAVDGARGAGGEWGRLIARRLFGDRGAIASRAALIVLRAWAAATVAYMFILPGYPLPVIALEMFKGHGARAFGALFRISSVWSSDAMLVGVIGVYALCISGPIWALFHVSEPRGRWIKLARSVWTVTVVFAALWLWDWRLALSIGVGAYVISHALFPSQPSSRDAALPAVRA
jgi:hypothetical protein